MENENRNDVSDFETARVNSLRCFEIDFLDGSPSERIFAHFHDAGGATSALLCFITYNSNGEQMITRGFNMSIVRGMKELTADNTDIPAARQRMGAFTRTQVQEERKTKPAQVQKRSIQ